MLCGVGWGAGSRRPGLNVPDTFFAAYDGVVCIDHLESQLYVVSTGLPLSDRAGDDRARRRLAWLRTEVEEALG